MLTLPPPDEYRVYVNMGESPELRTTELGAGVLRRATKLADGRDLIYYDDPDTALGPDRAVDARTLDPRPDTATTCSATSSAPGATDDSDSSAEPRGGTSTPLAPGASIKP